MPVSRWTGPRYGFHRTTPGSNADTAPDPVKRDVWKGQDDLAPFSGITGWPSARVGPRTRDLPVR